MQKKIALGLFLFTVFFLSGCSTNNATNKEVNLNAEGVSVNVDGKSVNIKTDDATINTEGDNVSIKGNLNPVDSPANTTSAKNTILIIDASGSMNALIGKEKKIDIAKRSAGLYVDKLAQNTNLSVLAYGHIGSNNQSDKAKSCAGIEEIYYYGIVNSVVAKSKIDALPANGWTPISKSLETAKSIIAKNPNSKNEILLVSDGKETCGGDPVSTAKSLCSSGIRVDVIGFNVSGEDEKQLQNIAAQCGGYASVNSAEDFKTIIENGNIEVTTPGSSVKVQNGKVDISTGNAKIETGTNGTKINTGNTKIETGANGTKINTGNVTIELPEDVTSDNY